MEKTYAAVPMAEDRAALTTRLFAYCIDTIVLFVFTMLFLIGSGLNIFLRSDAGSGTPSDGAVWLSVVILMATVPAWLVANVLLCRSRGQTVGQYVAGLGIFTEEGARPTLGRLLIYWIALHPLLFHPAIAVFWAIFAWASISLSASTTALVFAGAMVVLCLISPIANVAFSLFDREHRMIHDRIAGIRVLRLA